MADGPFIIPPPNVVATSLVSVPNTAIGSSTRQYVYLGYPALGNVVSFGSDLGGSGGASGKGNRLWLGSGVLGLTSAETVPIYDANRDSYKFLRTTKDFRSAYLIFVDPTNGRLVWDQYDSAHASSGTPTGITYYIPTSTGRFIPVFYLDDPAGAGLGCEVLRCPSPALASTTNDILGSAAVATNIATSNDSCFVNLAV